jgi:predicted NBD/HSP70 family sugar kinase
MNAPVARAVLQVVDRLGVACVNIARMLDPDAILFTGGMAAAPGLIEAVRRLCCQSRAVQAGL